MAGPLRGACLLFLTSLALAVAIHPARAIISIPGSADPCVRWAEGDLEAALQDVGVLAQASVTVNIQPGTRPEGFSLTVHGNDVQIVASDSVGAMYGIFELVEQIRNGGARERWPMVAATLSETTQFPTLEFRADNPFLHATDTSMNIDLGMWKPYIDMLAHNRFNVLDLHGAYNLTSTQYPNLLPLLVHVPEYPDAGSEIEQGQNLADFRTLVDYAKNRGIRVCLMDYSMQGMAPTGSQALDYTAKAVARLLQQVPNLYMIGFRIGESGEKTGFLQSAFLRGVEWSGRKDVHLYTRTWLTPEKQIDELGRATDGALNIEIKYNGEQLGPPYQAVGKGWGSYSYQGYIKANAPYHIIWQVRANGTNRFWAWADSQFIRRAVATFSLGRAKGFTLEPQIAYFPYLAAPYYRSPADQAVFHYMYERHWMWYFLWGRIAYNPKIPEQTLIDGFRSHFGLSGPAIYKAMQASGQIVPLICTYRFQGPDQRQWSPETESGCFVSGDPQWWYMSLAKRKAMIGASHYGIDVLSFLRQNPMDTAAFAPIRTFVREKIDDVPDGRVGPAAIVRILTEAARSTREAIAAVAPPAGPAADEWRLLKVDLLSSSYLADFYAHRILALTHLEYALETGSPTDYDQAISLLGDSRQYWALLASTADAVYAPLNDGMRHEWNFQWGTQLPMLQQLDSTAKPLWDGVTHDPHARPLAFTPADLCMDLGISAAETHSIDGGKVYFTCAVQAKEGVKSVTLWHKDLPSEATWSGTDMALGPDGQYVLTLPVHSEGMAYFFFVADKKGESRNYPDVLSGTPYSVIDPWEAIGWVAERPPGAIAEIGPGQ